jgi:hypothetical protein
VQTGVWCGEVCRLVSSVERFADSAESVQSYYDDLAIVSTLRKPLLIVFHFYDGRNEKLCIKWLLIMLP